MHNVTDFIYVKMNLPGPEEKLMMLVVFRGTKGRYDQIAFIDFRG